MIKKVLSLLIIFLISRGIVHSQTLTPSQVATISPQIRNRLQLLANASKGDIHFKRFSRRLKAMHARLTKLHNKIEKRISKISASVSVTNKLSNQFSAISSDIDKIEKEIAATEDSWKQILNTKNSQDFDILKTRINGLFDSMKAVIEKEKALLKEIKKYKEKPAS